MLKSWCIIALPSKASIWRWFCKKDLNWDYRISSCCLSSRVAFEGLRLSELSCSSGIWVNEWHPTKYWPVSSKYIKCNHGDSRNHRLHSLVKSIEHSWWLFDESSGSFSIRLLLSAVLDWCVARQFGGPKRWAKRSHRGTSLSLDFRQTKRIEAEAQIKRKWRWYKMGMSSERRSLIQLSQISSFLFFFLLSSSSSPSYSSCFPPLYWPKPLLELICRLIDLSIARLRLICQQVSHLLNAAVVGAPSVAHNEEHI